MTPLAAQFRSALAGTVGKSGHLPSCGHGQWLQSWSFDTRHECDVEECDRTGQPCSKRCAQVRAALRLEVA